jgi:hypothetical protein
MNIKPAVTIRQNYMDIQTFQRRERMLDLRAKLLDIESRRLAGEKWYSIDEVDNAIKKYDY